MEKAKSMEKVLCIGHAAYDITLPLETFPKENSKVRIGDKVECGGGAASNCATLLARWGMNTYFVGAVGNDYYGQIVRDEFQKDNIKMDYLTVTDDFKTTSSYILANTSNGSRTIVISRTKKEEAKVESLPDDATVIIADGEEPTLTEEAIRKNPNAISILDAGNVWLMRKDEARPGAEFSLRHFFDSIALGTGVGIRYDLSFLILRLDFGFALHVPYDTEKSGYYNIPKFKDGMGIHFAIGYPF